MLTINDVEIGAPSGSNRIIESHSAFPPRASRSSSRHFPFPGALSLTRTLDYRWSACTDPMRHEAQPRGGRRETVKNVPSFP